ncbi:MAG: ABC transporter substrate-binding protein, partial [Phreatobacter sp.]|nr:ABC transporter substrate-binding protein [Phreatobacter sp.]
TESLLSIVGSHVWARLNDGEKKIFSDVLMEAASRATDKIRESEQKLADEFRKLGKTVIVPDRAAFRAVAVPLHNDAASGAGWSKAEYDALQGLTSSS